ncbi:MAG: peptide ABC transporter substrate-binding protein [Planctomycetota bacterium]|nr:MAG: peptide ABC transporter substrate-binding protein [Planctomycetota bacterium]
MFRILAILFALFLGFLVLFLPFAKLENWESKGELRICLGTEPKTLDPAIATGVLAIQYIQSLQEGLITYDPKDLTKPIAGLAEKWEVSKDGKTYRFFLRKNARWSNGEPLTAWDFYYSWKRILDLEVDCEYVYMLYYIRNSKKYNYQQMAKLGLRKWKETDEKEKGEILENSVSKGLFRELAPKLEELGRKEKNPKIRKRLMELARQAAQKPKALSFERVGVHVESPHILVVQLESKTPYILDIFGFPTLYPVPIKAVRKYGGNWTKVNHILSCGAYLLEKWIPHYIIVLKKNPYYYNAKAVKLRQIVCFSIDKPTTALNYYETGVLDFLDKSVIPGDFVESLLSRPDFIRSSSFGTSFLRFNVTKPPFDDPRVRKAFTMAINRKEIINALRGGEMASRVLVPPILDYPEYQPQGLPYNPEKAKKLLKEAWANKKEIPKITFLSSSGGAKSKDIFLVLRNQWKNVLGVEVEPKFQEWQVYLDSLSNKKYNIAFGAWIGDYGDPMTFLDMWTSGNGNNRTGWRNPEYDQMIQRAGEILEHKKRMKLLGKAEKTILEDHCIIAPLYFRASYFMKKDYVKGFRPNVMGRILLKYLWVQKK